MSISWTQNSSGQFLVADWRHLLQIMTRGSLYGASGGFEPTDYWNSSYLQTVDIDLEENSFITPIGTSSNRFGGSYDGGLFQIKNWSYTGSETFAGLFGYAGNQCVLKRIRLSGVWTLGGLDRCGFVCGYIYSGSIEDVEGDFAEGTSMVSTPEYRGALVGRVLQSSLDRLTVRGSVDFQSSVSGTCGGVTGYIDYNATGTNWRNLATFPSGLSGEHVGGICGEIGYYCTVSNWLNGMSGNINGQSSGGICGYMRYAGLVESMVNSMRGDITSTSQSAAGGMVGYILLNSDTRTFQRCLNYMKGNITAPTGGGGIIGSYTGNTSGDLIITESIVAMQGSVEQSVRGSGDSGPSVQTEVTVDSGFGMSFDGNDYGTATMVVDNALVYDTGFTDLPYIDMSGTGSDGNSHNWDFVYANIGGKYPEYSHLSVHTAEVSAPFHTDFGLADSNSVVYLTYANLEEKSLYINSNLSIVETAAEVAFDYAKSVVLYGSPALAWTKNGSGQYLVESKEHLLQIMNQGSLYSDLGDHPTDYWGSSYLQTSDIDLANDHASIEPIGILGNTFTGEYDGGLFQIKNWSYTGTLENSGLFGDCSGCVLKRIRVAGVWTITFTQGNAGFVCGKCVESTIYDVAGNFSEGTLFSSQIHNATGVLFGLVNDSTAHGLSVLGSVNFGSTCDGFFVGGVLGNCNRVTLSHARNLASFPNGMYAKYAGGVAGQVWQDITTSNLLNAMDGDITGLECGGVIGRCGRECYLESVVNTMTGSIGNLATDFAGGVVGYTYNHESEWLTATRTLNYMRGDITGGVSSGGIVGHLFQPDADTVITKSIVAMQGNVEQSVIGSAAFTPSQIEVTVDTSFGMFFDTNDYGTATMVVDNALVYEPGFTDLPYIDLTGTDPDGNSYAWDFVYANIGGKYPKYTHLSAHTVQVSVPFHTDFGLADTNNVVYLAYANLEEKSLYIDPSLTIVETAAEVEVAFDHAKSSIMYGTPTPATTVLWTKDADDKFEVATKQHLLQLMNKGALYTDLGDRPTDSTTYWTHHYVQTAEIDFAGDIADVVHIGDETTTFLGSYDENGFEVLNWRGPGIGEDESLFGAYTTLEWTVNAEGQYEVATAEHLVQLMQRGLLYLDEGNFPADYWGASAAYIQTADIDLIDWHAKILPIGNATTNFYGQYDGGGHAISNWAYTQPEDSATVSASGLFGAVVNAEIKSVSLQGVWTLSGSAHASTYLGDGFLCGSATASTVYDIGSKFSAGSMMSGGSSITAPVTHRVGCLIGMASDSVVCNVTLGGTVDMKNFGADGHNNYVGGVIGYVLNAGSIVTLCRNVAIFPNGITGNTVGGLLGYFHMGSLKHCINAMQGDVVGITHAGGVCGLHVNGGSCEGLANSMTGSIQATENAGGIHGCVDASLMASSCQLMNYMSGNVAATNSGGVVGLIKRSVETGDVSVTNSIVAMHGTVDQPIHGSASFSPSALDAVVNTEFGMVYEKQIVGETTLQDFTTNPAFADLPYIPLVATDPDGNAQTFDFVFANLGGNFVYSGLFTHLSLHTTAVSAPLATDYGLDSSNAQVYLTYANLTKSEIFVDDTLTVAETAASIAYNHAKSAVLLGTASLPLICQPRAVAIKANIDASGSQFQLTYQATAQGSREIVAYDNFSEAVKIITGLSPETTYVVRLYADEALAGHVLVTTSENVAENYVVSDFFVGDLYDISSVSDKVPATVVNEMFVTGDVVEVDMGFARETKKETVFVKRGETIEVDRSGAILLPFETNGETQESTIKLSDTTSVQVGLDQASGDISVGGNLYQSGKSFIIDGLKATAWDI